MSSMQAWWTFLIESVPTFLWSEPIKYLMGIVILLFLVKVLKSMLHLTN